ncbi:MAG: hypothetical protein IKG70_01200 [Lachnospiraceae bacterium]|nr:hypothetical protein [Lachnospiraceae bacterium]
MKRFNKNIILAVFALAFIIAGITGIRFSDIIEDADKRFKGQGNGFFEKMEETAADIEKVSSRGLAYHNTLLDIHSAKENILGSRLCVKGGSTIAKADNGMLGEYASLYPEESLEEIAEVIGGLYDKACECESAFLYIAAPQKNYYLQMPENIKDRGRENYENFVKVMEKHSIPTLNVDAAWKRSGIKGENMFFDTDHHWTPNAGLLTSEAICKELNALYGFWYEPELFDPENYTITTYENYFLGYYGKKTGRFFTWKGADDIDLIVPKFETDLTEEQPVKGEVRNGAFQDTVLDQELIEEKDYYNLNPYATYSGGDFRLQIMRNNLNHNGKTAVLIRDSFGCVIAPFLSLQFKELHVVDLRDFSAMVGEKINVYEYIEEINPDYVFVLYGGVITFPYAAGRYDFSG